ncbi:hypothetical protein [Sphingomonas sp. Leaf33]|nr:hypothetical protein [Sphingomonas sp. Leaf33]
MFGDLVDSGSTLTSADLTKLMEAHPDG